MIKPAEKNYYPALTGIRAIAAWLVFVHHDNPFAVRIFGTDIHNFFAEMHIGVTIFFVLSGLLITLRYYDKAERSGTGFYNYMVNRFARIYPALFLVLTVNFIWMLYTGALQNNFSGGWKYYLSSVTLVRGFFADFGMNYVPQSWSLTAEECFYISAPIIFLLLRKHLRNIILLPVLLIGTGLLITLFFIHHPFHGLFRDTRFMFNFTFFGRCIEFFAGIATALYFKGRQKKSNSGSKFTIIGTLVIIACVYGLSLLHTDEFYGDHHPAGILINNLVLPVFGIAVLFYGLLTEKNIITRFLSSSPMILFGKSSYVFYLIHLGIAATLFYTKVSGNVILLFIFLNLLSVLIYKGFEHPVNIWLRKNLLRKEPATASSAS